MLSSGDQIYAGEAFYRVVSRSLDGSSTVSADPAWVVAEGIQTALAHCRAVPGDRYTEASFANFTAELDAVEQAMQTPGYDESALVKRIYDAYALLVDVYRHGFESNEPDVWGLAGSAPGSYVAQIADGGARTGSRGLYFASTDTTGSAGYNLWSNSRKTGVSLIKANPNTAYKVSFYYRLLPGG